MAELLHGLSGCGIALAEQIDMPAAGEELLPGALRRADATSAYAAPGGSTPT